MVDSGSTWTWVQCQGCISCMRIEIGNFTPSLSKTYEDIKYNSPSCTDRRFPPNDKGRCTFKIKYGSGDEIEGWVSTDRLRFERDPTTTNKFLFGCAKKVPRGLAFTEGEQNKVAGIFGLGAGRQSFLKQQKHITKSKLSYCLSSSPSLRKPTLLQFGDDANFGNAVPQNQIITTDLVPKIANYFVSKVVDILIDGKPMHLDSSMFHYKNEGKDSSGFMIDTGSPYSYLVPPAFERVKKEITDYFHRQGMVTLKRGTQTCFKSKLKNYKFPDMTYRFGGGDFTVSGKHNFEIFNEKGYEELCLAVFQTAQRVSLLGGLQQVEHKILIDASQDKNKNGKRMMIFAPLSCNGKDKGNNE